jgi:hypothetical protein
VALLHPADVDQVRLAEVVLETDPDLTPGLILVDSPDFDSVELSNRELALDLLEMADLVIFVTTATRYADFVPWAVLERARERGVPLLAVINRMPTEEADAQAVTDDYRRLLTGGNIEALAAFGALEIVAVPEGAIDPTNDGLARSAIQPIIRAIDRLREDSATRKEVARRALSSALAALPESIEPIAAEVAAEEEAAHILTKVADESYRRGLAELEEEIRNGTFLRSEVLRQWLDFVRAGPTARFLSEGIGKLASTLRSVFRPQAAVAAPNVREAAFSDLVASAVRRVDEAARRTAAKWAEDEFGAAALALDPALWGGRPELGGELEGRLQKWAEDIADEIAVVGRQRKGWAQAATVGLNVLGTSVMLAVFVHTGGLTGAEVGIGAATAVVNQKLLEAIFGEANVAAFVKNARDRLHDELAKTFDSDKARFVSALGPLATPTGLASTLREGAANAAQAVS